MVRGLVLLTSLVAGSAYAATAKVYVIEKGGQVTWKGSKVIGSSHDGTVNIAAGKIELLDGNIGGGTVTVDMTSLDNHDLKSDPSSKAKLEGHLKSADFFDVEKFPTAEFKITSVTPDKKKGLNQVNGELKLKGATGLASFPATYTVKGDTLTMESKFQIDRTKWGVKYNSGSFFKDLAADKIIKNEVDLGFKIVAKLEKSAQPATAAPASKKETKKK